MDFLRFLGSRKKSEAVPQFHGEVAKKEFVAATGLTERHFDRFEAEGSIRAHYDRTAHRFVVDNASDFVSRVMQPSLASWPPALPSLDDKLQRDYAASGGSAEIAARILEPFRYRMLASRWNDIVALARPSARLVPGGDARVGCTRIGGTPDVPAGFRWPHFVEDHPLGFVGQLDLAEIQAACPSSILPRSGLLSFFYDAKQEAWGFDPKDRGRWAVLYLEGPLESLADVPAEVAEEGRYRPVPLRATGELTLPAPDSLEVEKLGLSKEEHRAFWALYGELETLRGSTIHRVLGWPEQIQHDPAVEVQLPANGIYAGGPEGYQSDEGKRLMAARDVWQLVLQVDTDDAAGMMWGDAGRIYYMMRRDDLANRAWDDAWFSFQCY